MPGQALASNNPGRASSEIREPAKFLRSVDRLGLPPNLRGSFKSYYEACGSPIGANPECWKGLRKVAREIGISYRTLKRHHRQFKHLGLLEFAAKPNSDRRSKKWRINLDRISSQDWPDAICPRCRHKHTGDECGCELSPRHWPKKGWVERRCRCVPRPSEHSDRIGPQRVASSPRSSPPEASPTVPAAAPTQPAPPAAAPERENTLIDLVLDGSRKAERVRKLRADLGIRVAKLIEGCRGQMRTSSGYVWVDETHRDYRLPMPRDQAIREAAVEFSLSEAEARKVLSFMEPHLRGAGHEVPKEEEET